MVVCEYTVYCFKASVIMIAVLQRNKIAETQNMHPLCAQTGVGNKCFTFLFTQTIYKLENKTFKQGNRGKEWLTSAHQL